MNRPTIQEVASVAGVSTATVDRVLNGRGGVSDKSCQKVRRALSELEPGEISATFPTAHKKKFRYRMLVPFPKTNFSEGLQTGMINAPKVIEKFDISLDIKLIDTKVVSSIVETINETDPELYDGMGIFAVDEPGVRQAINALVERGLKVVTLVSDISMSRRHYFIGIDNMAAGCSAGTLMGRFLGGREGTIGVIAGCLRQRDHIDRLFGFEQIIRSRFPRLRILPAEEAGSMRSRIAEISRQFVEEHQDLCGIYSFGGGNAGLVQTLKEYPKKKDMVVIVHELSDLVRASLQDGTVDAAIVQDTGHFARSAVRILTALCSGGNIVEAQERVGIKICLADNVP